MIRRLVDKLVSLQVEKYRKMDQSENPGATIPVAAKFVRRDEYQRDKLEIAKRLAEINRRIDRLDADPIAAELRMIERTLDV